MYPEASWVIDEDTFISNLSSKVPTQQSVKFYVDNIVTGVNNLKGGYDADTDTPQLDTLPTVTVLQGDSYYVTVSGDFFTTAVDPGDLIIATIDNATLSGDWVVVNRKIQEELIDRWNSTHTTVSTESANWDSTYTTVSTESGNWDSTYTTTSANSAIWSAGGSSAVLYETALKNTGATLGQLDPNLAAVVTKWPTGYSQIDALPAPSARHYGAVDLQVLRQNSDEVAGSVGAVIAGGRSNKIYDWTNNTDYNHYGSILGGQGGYIYRGKFSTILGGNQNHIGSGGGFANESIASGRNCRLEHANTFMFNASATTFTTTQASTFNINASNGLRLVHDSNDHTGEVLTCLDADGHGKWQALSADEWNSTYTTVSTESANWDSTYTTVLNESAGWSSSALPDSTGTVYVSKDGDPSYDGLTINQPVSTISDAITIADNLITAGAYAANIEVLDSGQYIEDITLKDKMTLNAPSAELKGQLTTDNAAKCHVRLGRHVMGAFPATYCVTCGTSNAYLYYKADYIYTAGNAGILLGNGGYIFADVDEIDIGPGGAGISNTAGGTCDAQVKWLKYTGNTGFAINSTTSGSIKVYVNYIGPFGGSNFTNINATAGTCIIDAGQMYITGTGTKHWNIGASADVHIKANTITGSTNSSVGTPSSLITGERVDDAYSSYTTVSSNSATWANTQQTITSSASALTLDVSLGQSAITTLTENITSFTIQNASAGDSGVLIISSDGGGWTFPDQNGLGASHIVHTGSPDSISTLTSTTSSAVSIGWYCDGSRQFLYISDPT